MIVILSGKDDGGGRFFKAIYYGVSSGPIGYFSEIARFKLPVRTKRDGGGHGKGGDDRNSNTRMTGPRVLGKECAKSRAPETETFNIWVN